MCNKLLLASKETFKANRLRAFLRFTRKANGIYSARQPKAEIFFGKYRPLKIEDFCGYLNGSQNALRFGLETLTNMVIRFFYSKKSLKVFDTIKKCRSNKKVAQTLMVSVVRHYSSCPCIYLILIKEKRNPTE